MDVREDRWFVRFRGHTLGPLTSEQVKTSLRKGELGDGDKIASSRNPAWSTIAAHPDFSAFYQSLRRPDLGLQPVPSVDALRRKREARTELPSAAAYSASRATAARAETSMFAFESSDEAPSLKARFRAAMPVRSAPTPASTPVAAELEEKPRKKRQAAPGKKLGRPRKYPRPEDLSIADVVAPILNQAPVAKAAPVLSDRLSNDIPTRPVIAEAAAPVVEAAPAPSPTPARAPEPVIEVIAEPVPVPTETLAAEVEAQAEYEPAPVFVAEAEEVAEAVVAEEATPSPAVEASLSPAPARPEIPAVAPASEERLGAESLSLLQSLRDWRRQEEQMGGRSRATQEAAEPTPVRIEPTRPAAAYSAHRAENRLPLPKHILIILAALAVLVIGAAFVVAKKTRGPESVNFPDPSRPTAQPSKPGDPIPALRAPTRPQRD